MSANQAALLLEDWFVCQKEDRLEFLKEGEHDHRARESERGSRQVHAGRASGWLGEQGRRVALVDADVQGSSSAWLTEASPETKLFRLATPDDILDQVPKIAAEFDHVVIDGPAGLSELTRTLLFLTDLTLLPCGPSVLDLRAANDAIRVVRQVQAIRKGPPRAVLVPNKLQIQTRLSQELLETAKTLEIPTGPALRLRQAYADAVGQGTVVWRMGPRALDAALEMKRLFEDLLPHEATKTDERRLGNG